MLAKCRLSVGLRWFLAATFGQVLSDLTKCAESVICAWTTFSSGVQFCADFRVMFDYLLAGY